MHTLAMNGSDSQQSSRALIKAATAAPLDRRTFFITPASAAGESALAHQTTPPSDYARNMLNTERSESIMNVSIHHTRATHMCVIL